jgi:magnesium transporter
MAENQDENVVHEPFPEVEDRIRSVLAEKVQKAIEADDAAKVQELAGDLHEADLGALIEALDPESRQKLVELMDVHFDFAALTEVGDTIRDEILEGLSPEVVAKGMQELESDDAVMLLEDLDTEDRAEILEAMPPVERVALQRSLDYPENSAGRLMQTTLVTAPPFWTAGQMLDALGEMDEQGLPDSFFEIFVVDPGHRLLGNVFLDRLVTVRRTARLDEIFDPERRRVRVTDEREEIARLFERYNLVSLPVVDEADRLVGVITIDDIVDVIQEVAEDDIKALGGVSRWEEFSDSIWSITRSRFVWLFVNLITAFIASSVLDLFKGQMEKMVVLAVLVNIVGSQGGQAATQTMTVAVRALATRELGNSNFLRVTYRELAVGLLNGVAFAILTGLVAAAWFSNPGLGAVIGIAMVVNLIAGALGGIIIPVALEKSGFDPAVASGAFVTTVTDVVGNFSFLGVATLWFHLS